MSWTIAKPPYETRVEVEHEGQVIRVKAFFGRDGYRPHWRSEDETKTWPQSKFAAWRPIHVVCDRCGGDGKAHGSDRPFEYNVPNSYPGKCPVCNGSGTVR